MPSWVLRAATLRPPICERRPSEMASPAASSAARLIRKPEDSFSSDLLICPSVTDRLRYALSAAMLLLTRRPTVFLLGREVLPRYVRASKDLRGAGGVYGGSRVKLEAKPWVSCGWREKSSRSRSRPSAGLPIHSARAAGRRRPAA